MTGDEYRKGGPHDDVARNIRNEQQADAMPPPKEVHAEKRKHLAENGCVICGEDDPDNLEHEMPHMHSCRACQHGEPEPVVVCEDHAGNARDRWLAKQKERSFAEENVVALIVYDCDNTERVEKVDPDERTPPAHREMPKGSIVCLCGDHIKNIYYAEDHDVEASA